MVNASTWSCSIHRFMPDRHVRCGSTPGAPTGAPGSLCAGPARLSDSDRPSRVSIVSSTTVGVDQVLTRHHLQSRLLWKRDMMNERLTVLEWTTPSSSKAEIS